MATIPFAFLPLPVMKKITTPFLSLGYRIAKAFPYLELELQQAGIDADGEEYAAIMVFSFIPYFVVFTLIASMLMSKFVTNKYFSLRIVKIPEAYLLGLTLGLIAAALIFMQMSMYPKIKVKKKIREIESNLVYALRTMLVQIKSGISLFDSLNMIARGEFGQLSIEIQKAIDEINTGATEQSALQNIATKNPSPYLRKVIWQLVNGMKAGGDVSNVMRESVRSMTREQEIQIQRYGNSLRVLSLVYMMVGVIIPALGVTFLIVLGSFPKIQISEMTFWTLLLGVVIAEFMYLGIIKSKRPNLISA